uniref:Uncharacterized protein n=1 Tax=Nothoprocta perdicaria TaxID=30464 RepID=A0A8C6Z2N1_NOTPE
KKKKKKKKKAKEVSPSWPAQSLHGFKERLGKYLEVVSVEDFQEDQVHEAQEIPQAESSQRLGECWWGSIREAHPVLPPSWVMSAHSSCGKDGTGGKLSPALSKTVLRNTRYRNFTCNFSLATRFGH